MNDLKLTKEILNSIYDDTSFKAEVAELINSLIDEELSRDEPNCDFIDECINTLEELESENFAKVIPFVKKHAGKPFRQKFVSVAAACAILAAISFGAVAVSHTIEQKREAKTNTVTQAVTESATAERRMTTEAVTTTTKPTTQAAIPTGIRLRFGDSFKDEYYIGEKLDTSGITAVVSYSDGTEKIVPLADCKVTADDGFGTRERYETVKISFGNASETFRVRVLRKEDTKVLNSVYASFPEGFDFTTEDIDNIDLGGMEVYAVYSDRREKKLNRGEYTIKTEKLPNGTAFITITYEGVYTTFGIKEETK